jgi:hypothetical protein
MKLYIILGISLCLQPLFASNTFHWGVKAGMNMAQHYGTKDQAEGYIVKPVMIPGICSGAFINFPITDRFSIQNEVSFSQKGSKENIKVKDQPINVNVDYRMDYIELPVIMNMMVIRSGKWDISSTAGTCLSMKTYSNYSLKGTVLFNTGDSLETIPISAHSKLSDIDIFDYSFIYGGKVAYHRDKCQWFAEYRATFGWNSLSLPTYMNNGKVLLRNQAYSLLLGISY